MWGTHDKISSYFNPNYHRYIMVYPFRHVSPVIHNVQWEKSLPILYKLAHADAIVLIAVTCQVTLYAIWREYN